MTLQTATYLCIGCPLGCRLEVDYDAAEILEVRGFSCKRGKDYAAQEHTDPRRVVTTTVAVRGGLWQRLPVKTTGSVPKALVTPICVRLRALSLAAPVVAGTVIARNILNTGCDVIATRDLPALSS